MENIVQRVFAWSGPLFILIMLFCLIVMDFIPPISPALDAAAVAAFYNENRLGIRFGSTIMMQGCVLMMLCVTAISLQLRRIEGKVAIFSTIQLVSGVFANALFVFSAAAWTLAAFRPERDVADIQAWNDIGWFLLLMPATILSLQGIAIGLAILLKRDQQLYPRWVGYFNLWFAILFLPGALVTFFKTGPFAWDGILVFWLALGLFASWAFVMAWSTDRAIRTPDAGT
ncbi:MAG: hypothetical protein AAF438_23555 [Pseudomonadota bacterium]